MSSEYEFYKYSNAIVKAEGNKTLSLFNNARLKLLGIDELNVNNVNNIVSVLYGELQMNVEKYLKIIQEELEEEYGTLSKVSVAEYLEKYNPLLMYVFLNEVERKSARYAEGIIANMEDGLNSSGMMQHQKRNVSLWNTQMNEGLADFERECHLGIYKNLGYNLVQWVAQDGACGNCDMLNGEIFPIDDAPDLQHINCRCYLVPIMDEEEETDEEINEFANSRGYIADPVVRETDNFEDVVERIMKDKL